MRAAIGEVMKTLYKILNTPIHDGHEWLVAVLLVGIPAIALYVLVSLGYFDSYAAKCPPGERLIGSGESGMLCGPR